MLASETVTIPVSEGGTPAIEVSAAWAASSALSNASACHDLPMWQTQCDRTSDNDWQTSNEGGSTNASGSTAAGMAGVSASGGASHGASSSASATGTSATITVSCNASANGSVTTGSSLPEGAQDVFGGGGGQANGGAGGQVRIHEGVFLLRRTGSGTAEPGATFSVRGSCGNNPAGCEVGPGSYYVSVECTARAGANVFGRSYSGSDTSSSSGSATLTVTPR